MISVAAHLKTTILLLVVLLFVVACIVFSLCFVV